MDKICENEILRLERNIDLYTFGETCKSKVYPLLAFWHADVNICSNMKIEVQILHWNRIEIK